jgi:transposase
LYSDSAKSTEELYRREGEDLIINSSNMKHLKNHELIEKVIKEKHSLKNILDSYESEENGSPFFFKKRTIYFFLIVSIIIFLCGVIF